MLCEQGIDNMWRMKCIFCMLYEQSRPHEEWDSMSEFFESMSFEIVNLGINHGESGKVELKEFNVHDWYSGIEELYKAGFECGQLRRHQYVKELEFKQYCTSMVLGYLGIQMPEDLILLINKYV
jgi:hypothetical protein